MPVVALRQKLRVRATRQVHQVLWIVLFGAVLVGQGMIDPAVLRAQVDLGETEWIWLGGQPKGNAPAGVCYFRRSFALRDVEQATAEITCDDRYNLYVNGKQIGSGDRWNLLQSHDISQALVVGRNVFAVKAENTGDGPAGLAAKITIQAGELTDSSTSTDANWKVATEVAANWQSIDYDDSGWEAATSLGQFGRTAPWFDQVKVDDGTQATRFTLSPEFRIEKILPNEQTGSLVAMTFNERGEIIASRERGPLELLRDEDGDGVHDTVVTYGEEVKNCQGILALNGMVFAVGDGPDGTAFYRLVDENRDGRWDEVKSLLKFKGGMGEHGPHAAVLGPDGFIYLVIGNHAGTQADHDPASPHHHYYEGDLVQPRYEDAGGHAVGVKVPGGTVIRTDQEGSFVELVAGGFRNAYDIAFNQTGELFTYDSDMEWDEGLPWYRPTRINHIIAGAEFGWRSGWAKWPDYYIDSLGTTADVGRGSPTGVEFYNHRMFPVRFHDTLFACDWSMGRILAVKLERRGASYVGRWEVFLSGRPLNVTDIAVGPDGWLYFTTGGRNTGRGTLSHRMVGQCSAAAADCRCDGRHPATAVV